MDKAKWVLLAARATNEAASFVVFSLLDLLDLVLCHVYRLVDSLVEEESKPCYCHAAARGNIWVSEECGGSDKVVCVTSSTDRLEVEEISDTLYTRPPVTRRKRDSAAVITRPCNKTTADGEDVTHVRVEMVGGGVNGQRSRTVPRWSDCDCHLCNSWSTSCEDSLYVRVEEPKDYETREDVLFIHGFLSSSVFWTETLFPNFSRSAKSTYRLFAVDLLGFGRSSKPSDSFYTLREHVDMIERSVLEPYRVKSFHIVAHSLGCILALALAVRHPESVKSLTLLAPPYYPVPKGSRATQYVMRRIAPRRVWPLVGFWASLVCWYEHISRTVCLLVCKNHRVWEFIAELVTRNRVRTYMLQVFFSHTHDAAWHTLHNVLFGSAGKIEGYLETVGDRLKCDVSIFHGEDDEIVPVECSYNVQKKIPRATVKVLEKKDHITIVVARQQVFARELEEIWTNATK